MGGVLVMGLMMREEVGGFQRDNRRLEEIILHSELRDHSNTFAIGGSDDPPPHTTGVGFSHLVAFTRTHGYHESVEGEFRRNEAY